jgi:hypothetical protein
MISIFEQFTKKQFIKNVGPIALGTAIGLGGKVLFDEQIKISKKIIDDSRFELEKLKPNKDKE